MKYIIDLPVYRISEDEYIKEREAAFYRRAMREPLLKRTLSDCPSLSGSLIEDHERTYGGPWRYNEIVAYLRIHFLGSQIRAEYWVGHKKRIVRSRRKVFRFCDWKFIAESDVPACSSSDEIYAILMSHVNSCRVRLKGRYVDAFSLETLGPVIDWRKLMFPNSSP